MVLPDGTTASDGFWKKNGGSRLGRGHFARVVGVVAADTPDAAHGNLASVPTTSMTACLGLGSHIA